MCLAASVLTKGGKVLLARQFVEMPRMRIENLLATFPKLVGADKQHNTVETAEVRYVYQPIENLMVLLMTNKHSNIVADLELLRLFAKARPSSHHHLHRHDHHHPRHLLLRHLLRHLLLRRRQAVVVTHPAPQGGVRVRVRVRG